MNARAETHSKVIGYVLWIFGFTGAHRFYFGKPVSGTIWFFTAGLLLIGWFLDLFLIPSLPITRSPGFCSLSWACSASTGSTWANGAQGFSTCSPSGYAALA